MKILITGSAGFIGFSLALRLLKKSNATIFGIDNHSDYYDQKLKRSRVSILKKYSNYEHRKIDISDRSKLNNIFKKFNPDIVINLAAQAGVRYSLENPISYIESNLVGFFNIIDLSRENGVKHFIYASSSSVYGANKKIPFNESACADHPINLYAATKKSNELIAHSYSTIYNLPTTGLRFFTVYGPWGRPDMALFKFTDAILRNKPIDLYHYGKHERDFTYIDDIVDGIVKVMNKPPKVNPSWNSLSPDPSSSFYPYRIYNIGNGKPVKLLDFVRAIEKNLSKKALLNLLPLQKGEVEITFSDTNLLQDNFNYKPKVNIEQGILEFIKWYKKYYKIC